MGRRKYSFCQGFTYGRIKTLCSPYQVLILGKYKPRSTTAHDILHCQYLFHKNYAKMQKQRVKNEFNLVIQLLVEPQQSELFFTTLLQFNEGCGNLFIESFKFLPQVWYLNVCMT